jgi:hypothetical protein
MTQNSGSSKRRRIVRWISVKSTGGITVAQWPNVALPIFIASSVARQLNTATTDHAAPCGQQSALPIGAMTPSWLSSDPSRSDVLALRNVSITAIAKPFWASTRISVEWPDTPCDGSRIRQPGGTEGLSTRRVSQRAICLRAPPPPPGVRRRPLGAIHPSAEEAGAPSCDAPSGVTPLPILRSDVSCSHVLHQKSRPLPLRHGRPCSSEGG